MSTAAAVLALAALAGAEETVPAPWQTEPMLVAVLLVALMVGVGMGKKGLLDGEGNLPTDSPATHP